MMVKSKPPRIVFTGTFSVKKVAEILREYKNSRMDAGEAIIKIIESAEAKQMNIKKDLKLNENRR